MRNEIVWDAETGSRAKLGRSGTNVPVYMKHPSTRLWLLAYSYNGAAPRVWRPGDPLPEEFKTAGRFIAHNVEFERGLWKHILIPRYGFPPLPPSGSWFCTMAAVRMTALPGALKDVASILKLPFQKGDSSILQRMMKPRDPRPGEDINKTYWNDDPADFAALCNYCIGDVLCEMALYHWIQHHWDMSRSSLPSFDAPVRNTVSGLTENPSINLS
jgi:DNA polymerase